MPRITVGTVVKILIASLIVGIVLTTFNLDPREVLMWGRDALIAFWRFGEDALGWAFKYILIGAIVVVPIWLALYLLRVVRRRE